MTDMENAIRPSKSAANSATRAAALRMKYAEKLPQLRALYRAKIAEAATVANKIYTLERQANESRAAEGETTYGKAAGQ